MPDFTSALFLDHRHPPGRVCSWASLTSGRPAALEESEAARGMAARVAASQGAAAGVVHRSALHALWDVVDVLTDRDRTVVAVDAAAYPLARCAAAGAAAKGVPVLRFAHHDAAVLRHEVELAEAVPVVLTDGWCPDCSRPAPLAALLDVVAARRGRLVVDDTLATGVLGRRPGPAHPFGARGGGTLAWLGAQRRDTVVVASLAKAYGAPLAVTSGPEAVVRRLRVHGTRWHSSPPSATDVIAAEAAIADEGENDRRRLRLARLVARLRSGLRALGLPVAGRPFPLVTVPLGGLRRAASLAQRLAAEGVLVLLRRLGCSGGHAVSFSVTAGHRPSDVDRVLDVMAALPAGALDGPAA